MLQFVISKEEYQGGPLQDVRVFHTEFDLTHTKTRENTIPKKHLFIGGKLAAQTLPPLYPDTAQETIGRTGETPGKDRAAKTSIFH